MTHVNPEAFQYVLSKIDNGIIFEKFIQDLLCQIIGVDFIPIGGTSD